MVKLDHFGVFISMKYIISESQGKKLHEEMGPKFYEKLYEKYNLKSISYDEISDRIKTEISRNFGVDKSEMGPQTEIGMKIMETTAKIMNDFRNELRYIEENSEFLELLSKIQ